MKHKRMWSNYFLKLKYKKSNYQKKIMKIFKSMFKSSYQCFNRTQIKSQIQGNRDFKVHINWFEIIY